jgi:HEAT repeat protein
MPLIRKPSEKAPPVGEPGGADLRSPSAEVRWAAARAAADRPSSVSALAQALSGETDMRVREAIFTALARLASSESVDAVLPYLRSDDASLRIAAMDALRAVPKALQTRVPDLFADPDDDVRLLSCELARAMDAPQAQALLLSLIETDDAPNVCAAAIEVLSEIGDAEALPALTRCAARFPEDPFLGFAIKVALERLKAPANRD